MVITLAVSAFAIGFLIVGILRIVEFDGLGISQILRICLISLHILGCILFSAALVLASLNPQGLYRTLMTASFFGSVFTLFPIHIYIGIKRRIKLKANDRSR